MLPFPVDNSKARSFTSEYLNSSVPIGSESHDHIGKLDGWSGLQGAKLTDGAKWVRMHMLPHRLGGNAVDSNLTPARGSETNIKFSNMVEKEQTIWYKFKVGYHDGEYSAFPNKLQVTWGTYSKEAMIDLLGMSNWQYLFCDINLGTYDYGSKIESLRKGFKGMKLPEAEPSGYLRTT